MVRGALVVEVAAGELAAARRAIARAIVLGALGGSRSAAVEGEAVVFDGGRIVLAADGRASYELAVSEWVRIAQAVCAATFVSVTSTLAFAWLRSARSTPCQRILLLRKHCCTFPRDWGAAVSHICIWFTS